MFALVLPKFFFCSHKLFGDRSDDFVFALKACFKLLDFLRPQIHSARTGRAVKSCRSVLKEGFLPLIKQCGMELMLVADDRDRLVFNKV